jgi:O-antigen/teichoic acid export membrane protein
MLVAEKKYQHLDRLFFRSLCASMIVWCLSAVSIWLFMYVLNITHYPLVSRILPLFPTALLLLATAFNSAISALSIYLQAHKKEALASVSILAILLTALFGVVFGKRYGATGIAAVYLAVIALIQFPLSLYIFWQKRLQWHAVRIDTIT